MITDDQQINLRTGAAQTIQFTPTAAEDVSALSLAFYVAVSPRATEPAVLTLLSGGGISDQQAGGSFKVSFTRVQTLALTPNVVYWWECWDLTNDQVLAEGQLVVDGTIREATVPPPP